MAHGILSPSGWATWGNCPGSVWLSKGIKEEPSPYAEEGTKAHELACALGLNKAGKAAAPDLSGYDEEMIRCARGWAKLTGDYLEAEGRASLFAYESPIVLYPITGETARGTVDFWCVQPNGRLVVCDFKYGMGVRVQAERNGQLSIYAAALLMRLNAVGTNQAPAATSVEIVIYQPRMSPDPLIWTPTNVEFNDFVYGTIKPAAAKALWQLSASNLKRVEGQVFTVEDEDGRRYEPELVPGEAQCRFCRAKAICPALANKVSEEIERDFEVIAPPAPSDKASPLPAEQTLKVPTQAKQLARVLPWLETIEGWCSACRAAAHSRLEQGERIPGWKLVAGRRGPRKWSAEAEETLNSMRLSKALLYEKKLLSPAKAEKAAREGLIGIRQWKAMQKLMVQADGKPVLAPESDPRPAIAASIEDDFEVLPISEKPSPAAVQQENMPEGEDPFDFI